MYQPFRAYIITKQKNYSYRTQQGRKTKQNRKMNILKSTTNEKYLWKTNSTITHLTKVIAQIVNALHLQPQNIVSGHFPMIKVEFPLRESDIFYIYIKKKRKKKATNHQYKAY